MYFCNKGVIPAESPPKKLLIKTTYLHFWEHSLRGGFKIKLLKPPPPISTSDNFCYF